MSVPGKTGALVALRIPSCLEEEEGGREGYVKIFESVQLKCTTRGSDVWIHFHGVDIFLRPLPPPLSKKKLSLFREFVRGGILVFRDRRIRGSKRK